MIGKSGQKDFSAVGSLFSDSLLVLNDFDFERPKANLATHSSIIREHQKADYTLFDYPGEYQESDHGEIYARTRMEALHSQYEIIRAKSDVRD